MADLSTDYVIVGAGAVGLAFADTLLSDLPDVHLTLVDRDAAPGGHWNHAYRFVTLHQPSAFYGVNSLPLGSGARDTSGLNAGMQELATGAEVLGYFDTVLRRRLLASGRVRWLPLTEHLGGGRLRHLASGEMQTVTVRRSVVHAAYHTPSVPALTAPRFGCDDGVALVTPGGLTHPGLWQGERPAHFAVVGAGKTAMDTALWLLTSGVPAHQITWVMPRDSWLINRRCTQPGLEDFDHAMGGQAAQIAACAQASDLADLFRRLEEARVLLRLDPNVTPDMFHYATMAEAEMDALRRITDVVRLGRVQHIGRQGMRLDHGVRAMPAGTLYIDCTASAVTPRPMQPVFQPGLITPQLVRVPQPTFSAALIAHVEAGGADMDRKNQLCQPVHFPDRPAEWPLTLLGNLRNEGVWAKEPGLRAWISASRLDGFRKVIESIAPTDTHRMAILGAFRTHTPAAVANLGRLAGMRGAL